LGDVSKTVPVDIVKKCGQISAFIMTLCCRLLRKTSFSGKISGKTNIIVAGLDTKKMFVSLMCYAIQLIKAKEEGFGSLFVGDK
jgi:hypothetical protein